MAKAILCSKIRYPHFWTNVTLLPIGHFITLHNNNGLNSKNFEDIEITKKTNLSKAHVAHDSIVLTSEV